MSIKKLSKDALAIGKATIGSTVMGRSVTAAGGDAKPLENLTRYMRPTGTTLGAGAALKELKKLGGKGKKY